MSIADVIARLQVAAGDGSAAAPLAQAKEALDNTVLPLVMQAVERLVEIRNTARTAIEGQPASLGEIEGAAEHAAGAIEDAIALVQSAAAGTQQSIEHEGAFRQTILEVANRLAGS